MMPGSNAMTACTASASSAPGMPDGHANAVQSGAAHTWAVHAMMAVPQLASHAAANAKAGTNGASISAISPVMVAQLTNGATMMLARTDSSGICGSIRICMGKVNICADRVVATA